jgi:DNA-binding transcriptional MerR regulator
MSEHPIYEGYSERVKIVKKFDRVINPIRFVNEEILKLGLERHFVLDIIKEIQIIPEWRKKDLKLKKIRDLIDNAKQEKRNYLAEKESYSFRKTDFDEEPSNFLLRLILAFFTFGLSFIGYNSEENALLNKKTNRNNRKWNASHKGQIDQKNSLLLEEITTFNKRLDDSIFYYQNLYKKTKEEEINHSYKEVDDGWRELRHSSNFSFSYLNGEKGIYIIWNKTKDKHYVGQSKNLGKRLNQHFTNGEVKNVIFAKDWYAGDDFFYKYYLCQTKDELDSLEKEKIEEYNAFDKGYNSTGGNL